MSYLLAKNALSKFIESFSTIGAIASKKCKCCAPVNFFISSANKSDVSGPDARITGIFSGIFVISSLIIFILLVFLIVSSTFCENRTLSIARALPAGTCASFAISIKYEPSMDISCFKSPLAFVGSIEPRLLLHTNSARFSVECAPVVLCGRISYKSTLIFLFANCNAASQPARPAPITITFIAASSHHMIQDRYS